MLTRPDTRSSSEQTTASPEARPQPLTPATRLPRPQTTSSDQSPSREEGERSEVIQQQSRSGKREQGCTCMRVIVCVTGKNSETLAGILKDYATVKSMTIISYVMDLDSRLLPGLCLNFTVKDTSSSSSSSS